MLTINATLGVCWSILSFGFFVLCRHLARPLASIRPTTKPTGKQIRPYIYTGLTHSNIDEWERLNLIASWLHSLITGLSVIYSFWAYAPYMYNDLVTHVTLVTYLTCALSLGYFWYDLCDIISNKRGSELTELVLHHILVSFFLRVKILK